MLFAGPPKPEDYEHRRAGIHAHNRWMVDFCARRPERRAGIGQIFLNDIDDAIADATWIKEHGLRGGVLLPHDRARREVGAARSTTPTTTALWAALQDLDIPVHLHGGTGSPDYGRLRRGADDHDRRGALLRAPRPFVHMLLSGVFERFPRLKFVITESGLGRVPADAQAARRRRRQRAQGRDRRAEVRRGHRAAEVGDRVLPQNVWVGASFPEPRPTSPPAHLLAPDRLHVGQRLPPRRGHRARSPASTSPGDSTTCPRPTSAAILGENAAKLYGFDLDALAPLAAEHGPTVEELSRPLTELPDNPNSALRRNAGEGILV